jgi:hypothetical protein
VQKKQEVATMPKYELQVILDERRRGQNVVSLNPNLNRLIIYRNVWEDLEKGFGKAITHILLLVTDQKSDAFWVKPCEESARGARKVSVSKAGGTKMLSARMLFNRLKWADKPHTVRCETNWDKDNEALMVDLSSTEARIAHK